MNTFLALTGAEITFTVIAVAAFILGGFWLKQRKKRKRELNEDGEAPRSPSADKTLYNGVILNDLRWDNQGKAHYSKDNGFFKGWVSGPRTAMVCANAGVRTGHVIHTYDRYGNRHERAVVKVDRSLGKEAIGSDIVFVLVNNPWPDTVLKWTVAGHLPDTFQVMHIDGTWSRRKSAGGNQDSIEFWASQDASAIERLLQQGESGLPWRMAVGLVCGHTWRVREGHSPNYVTLRPKMLSVIKNLEESVL